MSLLEWAPIICLVAGLAIVVVVAMLQSRRPRTLKEWDEATKNAQKALDKLAIERDDQKRS